MKLCFSLTAIALTGLLSSLSAQAFVTTGFKWDSTTAGQGAALTWGYAQEGSACRISGDGCGGGTVSDISANILPGGASVIDQQVRGTFDAWSDVADLSFTFTTDTDADILIGAHAIDGGSNTLAHAFTSFSVNDSGLNQARTSDIHLDSGDTFGVDANTRGGFFFNTLAHEIGHVLGLDHVSDTGSLMNAIIQRTFVGPQADDIAGVQSLYGARAIPPVTPPVVPVPPPVTPVPLPAAFWMMLSGFGVFTAMRKRIAVL